MRQLNADTRNLFWILSICFFTEIVAKFLYYYELSLWHLYNFSFIIHNYFWLKILLRTNKTLQRSILIPYLIFSIIVFGFMDKVSFFNKTIMIVGALIYLVAFIIISYKNLTLENIDYFKSNHFILIASPVIFFFGLSILFGFNSQKLLNTPVIGSTNLYRFIIIFVNIIYYSLMNIYLIKERKDYARNRIWNHY